MFADVSKQPTTYNLYNSSHLNLILCKATMSPIRINDTLENACFRLVDYSSVSTDLHRKLFRLFIEVGRA